MSNIVPLFARKAEKPELPINTDQTPEAMEYMLGFYDWAAERGINTENVNFKYECAAIMSLLQGMLMRSK